MRIMALDIGTKNIGVAISDETCTLAQGREVILRKSRDFVIARVQKLVDDFDVKEIIVGLPVHMDGGKGKSAEDSMKFAELFRERLKVPVKMWDERLSTKEAEHIMIDGDMPRKKRKKRIDMLAAEIILQGYLDSLNSESL